MKLRTILPAVLGGSVILGAASPAFADWGSRPFGWHDRGWQNRGWQDSGWRERSWREQAWRERAWREHLWRQRQAFRYYNPPPVGVVPGYPHWYR